METSTTSTNDLWKPRVMVIGPGGIKALKALGFLAPLEDYGLLDHIDTYCGVSIGAIISLLMIVGYSIREIVGGAIEFDIFKGIEDFDFYSSIENRGLISNEPARKHLSKLVVDKLGNIPSLHNLYMMTGKSFIIVTLNATDNKCEMMSPFSHPTVSCVDATLFSMNIPFLFYQLIYKSKIYVDGALANPYPVDYFDDGNTNILGIYMQNNDEKMPHEILPGILETPNNSSVRTTRSPIINKIPNDNEKIISLSSYFFRVFDSLINQRRENIIQNSSSKCKHISLNCKSVNTIGIGSDINDKSLMLVEGYNQGRDFLIKLKNNNHENTQIQEKLSYKYPQYYADVNI